MESLKATQIPSTPSGSAETARSLPPVGDQHHLLTLHPLNIINLNAFVAGSDEASEDLTSAVFIYLLISMYSHLDLSGVSAIILELTMFHLVFSRLHGQHGSSVGCYESV